MADVPYRFNRTRDAASLRAEFNGLEAGAETGVVVGVAGRVMLHRPTGRLVFSTLRDSSGSIQLFAGAGWTKDLEGFKARFNVTHVTTLFNMTEVSSPIAADGWNLVNTQSCGRPRPGVTARIVDENDEPLPPGKTGELVLRADDPWEFNSGYWQNPGATAEAWRNQWLHTGDGFQYDEDGNFYFVDRIKDCLRRRGENISSFEVEVEVDAHPAILESAAVAVPSEHSEDELKVVAALKPGCTVEAADLLEFLKTRLPAYMVPRYLEIRAEELPKTPTGKVQKVLLRATGTTGAWDREAG